MGLFDLFRKKRKPTPRKRRKKRISTSSKLSEELASQAEDFKNQFKAVNKVLHKHDIRLCQHKRLIDEQAKKCKDLEQIISTYQEKPKTEPVITSQPVSVPERLLLPEPPIDQLGQRLHLRDFTHQEKRILNVFFHHRDMALSYVDIGKVLGKSPHTVKNQINQIRIKADLFDKSIGNDSRNRFRLKKDLHIEKYLDVPRPNDQDSRPS